MSAKEVEVVKVDSEETRREMEWLKEVLSSNYGPWGGLVMLPAVQGGPGGVTTLTSHTPKLLQLLRAENPLNQAIISHLRGHAQAYRDATLYAGTLTCKSVSHVYSRYSYGWPPDPPWPS